MSFYEGLEVAIQIGIVTIIVSSIAFFFGWLVLKLFRYVFIYRKIPQKYRTPEKEVTTDGNIQKEESTSNPTQTGTGTGARDGARRIWEQSRTIGHGETSTGVKDTKRTGPVFKPSSGEQGNASNTKRRIKLH